MAQAAPIPVAPPATTATLLARRDMGRYSFVVELLLMVVGRGCQGGRPWPRSPRVSLFIGPGRRRGLLLRGTGAPPTLHQPATNTHDSAPAVDRVAGRHAPGGHSPGRRQP